MVEELGETKTETLIGMESKINDFVVHCANMNGTGSASANALFMKARAI